MGKRKSASRAAGGSPPPRIIPQPPTPATAVAAEPAESKPESAADIARAVLAACVTAPLVAFVLGGGVPEAWRQLHLSGSLAPLGLGREALALGAERQLLIAGTMGAGTTQMAHDLTELGLEIAHESSDPRETHCRDGTVSWAHGLQFLEIEPTDLRSAAVTRLCSKPRFSVWSSSFYDGSRGYDGGRACRRGRDHYWDKCWQAECLRVASQELGCAVDSGGNCTSPFAHTLLQVRHPLKTIGTLVAAFCNGTDTAEAAQQSSQLDAIDTLLPPPTASVPPLAEATGEGQCSLRFGWYWVQYINMLLPHVAEWYRVEDTPPCKVLLLGGVFQDEFWDGSEDAPLPAGSQVPPAVALRARSQCAARLASGEDSYDSTKSTSRASSYHRIRLHASPLRASAWSAFRCTDGVLRVVLSVCVQTAESTAGMSVRRRSRSLSPIYRS